MTATAAALGGLGLVSTSGADDHTDSFALEQDGECYPVVPLSGEEPVEELYRWGRDILSWSSEGTRELQRPETSLLFLYRGPFGLSLVVVHDRGDDETPGGIASFRFEGVPSDAEWAVKDDLYRKSTNVDQWEIDGAVLEANESTVTDDIPTVENETALSNETASADGNVTVDYATDGNATAANATVSEGNVTAANATVSEGNVTAANATVSEGNATVADATSGNATVTNLTDYDARTDEIDWWWTEGRTDGGALRGLGVDGLRLRIEPAFNDAAALAEGENQGEITSWQLLSGDIEDPDRTELALDQPVTLRAGRCETGGEAVTGTPADGDATETPDDEEAGTETPDDEEEEDEEEEEEEEEEATETADDEAATDSEE